MRSINEQFYNGKRWKETRKYVMQYYGGLCQQCLKEGRYNSAYIVHHKIHLNKYNVNDDNIAYGLDNLIPLCLECHNKVHGKNKTERRYNVKPDGTIEII